MEVPYIIHNYITKVEICPATYILWTQVLSVSDAVSDLLGLGVVEIMGSQLTDMVSVHWWQKCLFFQKGPPRVTQIVNYLREHPHAEYKLWPIELYTHPKTTKSLIRCTLGTPLWPELVTHALSQVHPCDHNLLRELFQPGQDNRQVVVRARYNTGIVSQTSPLQLKRNPLSVLWVCFC